MNDKNNRLAENSISSNNDLIANTQKQISLNNINENQHETGLQNSCGGCSEKNNIHLTSSLEDKSIVLAQSNGVLGTHFCKNVDNIDLHPNDKIIIKIDKEFEYATVIEPSKINCCGNFNTEPEGESLPKIERIVTEKDNERYINNVQSSIDAKQIFLAFVMELDLEMKLVDIYLQFDRKKMFFFYTADGRVDFRELAKKLAAHFRTRIELRQIGVRDEAKRLGGLATCGREFCCSSFMHNFKKITTDIAIENNISTSISKYTGPCGKLKCCLSFEL